MAWRRGSRPWRVFPLALFAAAAMTSLVSAASAMVRDLSHQRYAAEVLRDQMADVEANSPFTSVKKSG